ncbi:hypothetical protein N8T08_011009 [Aspergillus melleus]|uniref:Uncharacterized protein n=1 Tax=Aspergillus melleus TaxID=138277 RepID=A0ACC3AQN9_9EURO|nr:hypothetical protein N8T08_011009 [Aspergillus melleus]
MKPYHRLVPGLQEQIPVLICAGDADYICNWLGNKAWTEVLEWPGQAKYASATLKDLKVEQNEDMGKNIDSIHKQLHHHLTNSDEINITPNKGDNLLSDSNSVATWRRSGAAAADRESVLELGV